MKRNRFTDEQIVGILKEHEAGMPVSELCRKHGVSDASIYKWKTKFGGMDVSEAKRLKTLEDKNTKLKSFGKKMVTPAAKRRAVAHLMAQHRMSEQRACKAIGFCPHDNPLRTSRGDNQGLRERMNAAAFGYRRVRSRWSPMIVSRWTSCRISSPMVAGSGF